MRLAAFIAVAALSVAGAASAKAIGVVEAKSVFFGLDMGGVYEPDGTLWRECIAPSGKTQYWIDGFTDTGRLTVRPDGALCFSYESSEFKRTSCFSAERKDKGWRFVNVTDPSIVFVAQRATPTKVCEDNVPTS